MASTEMIVIETDGPGVPSQIVLLADEMEEDPRCHLVVVGATPSASMMVSVWDAEVATDVEDGLRGQLDESRVRRLSILA